MFSFGRPLFLGAHFGSASVVEAQMRYVLLTCLAATLGMVACATDTTSQPPPVDVTIAGPYLVGQRTGSLTYQPRGISEERTLRVILWYPTEATRGTRDFWGDSILDAEPIATGDFPVLVFSHGTSSFAECAYSMMEHFASHGFLVASADHTGDTTANRDDGRTTEMYFLRPQDVSALIDHVYDLPESDPLSGRLTEELVLAGHSYGGWNVFAAVGASYDENKIAECDDSSAGSWCSNMTDAARAIFREGFRDERVKVLIPMAPGNADVLGPHGVGNITIPVLHMTASLDGNCPNETQGDPYWNHLQSPHAMRVNYDRGGHHSYILTCEVSPRIGDENGGGCGDEFTDWQTLLQATNVYSLAFARYHLFLDDNMLPILNGESHTFEEVTLTYK